ncbi:hypothetical protein B0H67DRAFT_640651 [Lasiosphaeris hirsuta]|uniref:UBZ4-type domain-containing protein n=1 Tax=Lasiosphaeris hirsuta TaxID=260670 RepID=A0AA40AY11_9PEZI|nr:hypothetical protein B0H67DRAFT_640651 [Lasiosphaeris hirsuta]
MPRVPTTNSVIPGARVNIVLKQDQATGRTEAGVVQDVLTRGNHPRGIKVRLADGRVGRVQSMAAVGGGSGSAAAAVPPSNGQPERGGREEEEEEEEGPTAAVGLDAYLKPARRRQGRGRAGGEGTGGEEALSCPVCGEFEGDEAAVAHHVAGHFDD